MFGCLIAFAVAAFAGGIALALSCAGSCARAGVALYAAGGPVSGLFAAVAGELPIAWPLDLTVWILVAFAVARRADRPDARLGRSALAVIGFALVYGLGISLLVTPV